MLDWWDTRTKANIRNNQQIKMTEKPKANASIQDTNVYRLANRVQPRKAMFLSKIIMKKHGSIQIESVGIATS